METICPICVGGSIGNYRGKGINEAALRRKVPWRPSRAVREAAALDETAYFVVYPDPVVLRVPLPEWPEFLEVAKAERPGAAYWVFPPVDLDDTANIVVFPNDAILRVPPSEWPAFLEALKAAKLDDAAYQVFPPNEAAARTKSRFDRVDVPRYAKALEAKVLLGLTLGEIAKRVKGIDTYRQNKNYHGKVLLEDVAWYFPEEAARFQDLFKPCEKKGHEAEFLARFFFESGTRESEQPKVNRTGQSTSHFLYEGQEKELPERECANADDVLWIAEIWKDVREQSEAAQALLVQGLDSAQQPDLTALPEQEADWLRRTWVQFADLLPDKKLLFRAGLNLKPFEQQSMLDALGVVDTDPA